MHRLRLTPGALLLLASSLVVVAAAPERPAGAAPAPLTEFLSGEIGFDRGHLANLERGEAVVRSLDTSEASEIAIAATIRVGIAKEAFLERFRDIARFKKAEAVLQIGKFGRPARLEDLDGLTIDKVDLDALRACRPGDCHFALTAEAITSFPHDVDRSAPDFAARADAWVKRFLLDRVHAYLVGGAAALPVYASRRPAVDVGAQFSALLDASPTFFGLPDALKRHLREYPNGMVGGVESFVYWSKEKVGPKPVISLTHVVIYLDSVQSDVVSIASKQIYASHYFEASLGLTVAVDAIADNGADGMYLVYLNRSRSDALTGFMGPVRRAIVRSRSRAGAEEMLRRLKRALEAEAGPGAAGTAGLSPGRASQ